ncbi:hypothetical protein [Aureivirga sp. CE67]|uniref:hypothetical protein n=1 Tax=Aureivirga sp. CE67 TaxID=1788983 RepID=UPI0018CB4878|nr:hypothetical protein [Aureivirga sp. CE67]
MKRVFLSVFTVLLFISCQKETYQDSNSYTSVEDEVFDILGLESKEFSSKIVFRYSTYQRENSLEFSEGNFETWIVLRNQLFGKIVAINKDSYIGIDEELIILSDKDNKQNHIEKPKNIFIQSEKSCQIAESFQIPRPILLKNTIKEVPIDQDLILEFEIDENYQNSFVIDLTLNGGEIVNGEVFPKIHYNIPANTNTFKISSEDLKATFSEGDELILYIETANYAENECQGENLGVLAISQLSVFLF